MLASLAFVKVLLLALCGTIWLLSPNTVVPLLLVLLLATMGILSYKADVWHKLYKTLKNINKKHALLAACITAWLGISSLWHPFPEQAFDKFTSLLITAVCMGLWVWSWRYTSTAWHRWNHVLIGGFLLTIQVLALAFVWQEHAILQLADGTKAPVITSMWNKGTAMLVLWLWPIWLLLSQRQQHKLGWLLVAIVALLVAQTDSLSAQIGLGVGALTFLLVRYLPTGFTKILWIGVGAFILTTPLLLWALANFIPTDVMQQLPNSSMHRLAIWNYVTELIANQPLWGYGLHASRHLGEMIMLPHGSIGESIPLHPHHMALQWWLELGFIGVALITTALLWWLHPRQWITAKKETLALWWAYWACVVVITSVSYGAWQTWWVAALILTSALTATIVKADRT